MVKNDSDIAKLPWALTAIENWEALELTTFAGPEAQVAALADDIAYNNHDLDDGLNAGLFSVEDVTQVPFVGQMFDDVRRRYPDISESRLIHESVRDMIGFMVADVLAETRRRIELRIHKAQMIFGIWITLLFPFPRISVPKKNRYGRFSMRICTNISK